MNNDNKEPNNDRSPMMSTQEISKYLGVHEMTVYRWLKKGVLPGFKVGGRWRSKKEVLDQFLMRGMNVKHS
ncbi:MAG: helix-turn-helix domain-containing protein [Candidatus Omnitrophica bacterium]|nr:helix-turn-helix domain-containing protein [Candidatus Omnitrophota bacterium]